MPPDMEPRETADRARRELPAAYIALIGAGALVGLWLLVKVVWLLYRLRRWITIASAVIGIVTYIAGTRRDEDAEAARED